MTFTHTASYGRLIVDVAPYDLDVNSGAITADFYIDTYSVNIEHGAVSFADIRRAKVEFIAALKKANYSGPIVATCCSVHGVKAAKALGFTFIGNTAVANCIDGELDPDTHPVFAKYTARKYA